VEGVIIRKEQPTHLELELAKIYGKTIVTGVTDSMVKFIQQSDTTPSEQPYVQEGETISIDGSSGGIFRGAVPTINPLHNRDFQNIMHWTEKYKKCMVKCCASSYEDVEKALDLGAEGVGLFSTDDIFRCKDCIGLFHRMLLCESASARLQSARDLEQVFRKRIYDLYMLMQSKKIVLRLLNGPLSQFFPHSLSPSFDEDVLEISKAVELSEDDTRTALQQFHETNPLMGCRGSRLEACKQEITRLQARAITGKSISIGNCSYYVQS
jgi:pyruvate,orthophosphate dikinase